MTITTTETLSDIWVQLSIIAFTNNLQLNTARGTLAAIAIYKQQQN